jgi:hypothetical protein
MRDEMTSSHLISSHFISCSGKRKNRKEKKSTGSLDSHRKQKTRSDPEIIATRDEMK